MGSMSTPRIVALAVAGFVTVCLLAIGLVVLLLLPARSQTTVPVSQVISLAVNGRVQEIQPEGSGYVAHLKDGAEYRFLVTNEDNLRSLLQEAGVSQPELILKSN